MHPTIGEFNAFQIAHGFHPVSLAGQLPHDCSNEALLYAIVNGDFSISVFNNTKNEGFEETFVRFVFAIGCSESGTMVCAA
jgi:hypothetical protein